MATTIIPVNFLQNSYSNATSAVTGYLFTGTGTTTDGVVVFQVGTEENPIGIFDCMGSVVTVFNVKGYKVVDSYDPVTFTMTLTITDSADSPVADGTKVCILMFGE
jgi:hypothetical protein